MYLVVAWLILQIADVTLAPLGFPPWSMTLMTVLVIAGFPMALILGWFFDFTKEGIVRTLPAGRESASADELALQGIDYVVLSAAVIVIGIIGFGAWKSVSDSVGTTGRPDYVAVAPPRSIAVLPFVTLSNDSDARFFGYGIAEELLNRLAQIRALKVTARTSSFGFAGQNVDIRSVAAKLGVQTILEGSIRMSGNKLRVTAQLVDAMDGYQLWSDAFDREFTDIFAVQDEIAAAITETLKIELLDGTVEPRRPTSNMQAYEHFLRGRYFVQSQDTGQLIRAVREFEEAVALDEDFADAWAGLAEARMLVYTAGWKYGDLTTDRSADKAQAERDTQPALIRALSLSPDLPAAHTSLALFNWYFERDVQRAKASAEKAIGIAPNQASALKYLGLLLIRAENRPGDAVTILERAQALDPLDANTNSWLAEAYYRDGQRDNAIAFTRIAVDLDPGNIEEVNNLAFQLMELGQLDEALIYAEQASRLAPEDPQAVSTLAYVNLYLDEIDAARGVIEHLEQLDPDNLVTYYARDALYAATNDVRNRTALAERQLRNLDLTGGLDLFSQGVLHRAFIAYVWSDRLEDAKTIIEQRLDGPFFGPHDELMVLLDAVYLYDRTAQSAKRQDALNAFAAAYTKMGPKLRDDSVRWLIDAGKAIVEGNRDAAIDALEKYVAESAHTPSWYLLDNPLFAELHDDPRFMSLVGSLNAEVAELRENARRQRESATAQDHE